MPLTPSTSGLREKQLCWQHGRKRRGLVVEDGSAQPSHMATIRISSATRRSPHSIVPGFLGFMPALIRSNFRIESRGHFDESFAVDR